MTPGRPEPATAIEIVERGYDAIADRFADWQKRISGSTRLERVERLVELLGREVVEAYTVMRRYELQRFDDHVTDWERSEYLEIY